MKSRTILYTLVLVAALAFALPASAASYLWTNANACECWNVATNWDPNAAGGPTDGDVVTFDGNETEGNLPDSQLLGGGNTVGFVFTAGYTTTIEDMLNGGAIGAVTVNHASAAITPGANITGAITITAGYLNIAAPRTLGGTVAVEAAGVLDLDASGTVVASDTITMGGGDSIVDVVVGTTLDIAATKSLAGTGIISNTGTIQGTVNMTSAVWGGDGTITVDEDGVLNLGTDASNGQSVDVAADVTIGDHFTCYGFDGSSGEITGADKIITVGAGGLTYGAATLNAAGTLNVIMTGIGGLSWSTDAANRFGTITFSGTTTAGSTVTCNKVAGAGTAAGDGNELRMYPTAADFWALETESDGWALVRVGIAASRANATLIDVGSSPFVQYYYATTLTLTGGLSCGTFTLNNDVGAATLDMNGGDLNCTTFKFDEDDGTVLLGEGDITITGVIERVAAEHGCSIDFETSRVTLGDDVTLAFAETDGTVDFGSAIIEASGDLTIDGADAATIANTDGIVFSNANTVTVSNVDYATTSAPIICVSCVDGTGNGAGVEFQVPQRTLMGIGF